MLYKIPLANRCGIRYDWGWESIKSGVHSEVHGALMATGRRTVTSTPRGGCAYSL